LGDHQRSNAALALGAVELLLKKGVRLNREAVYDGLARTRWPGRLEVLSQEPFVLLDGAHNPSAVRTLKRFLSHAHRGRRLILVVGVLEDKAWKPMLRELSGLADQMILTKPEYERSADPYELASFARLLKLDPLVIPRLPDAIAHALKEAAREDTVCITGSLYTVGDAKAWLEELHGLG
jgi:dihydrofolate synthase/folylpolyglutamate synthase